MNATITTLAVILAVTACDARQDPVRQRIEPPEVVLTGCIVQGSSPSVLVFDNAKADPKSALEQGARYLLTFAIEDTDLRTHLNHLMRITGQVDLRVSKMPDREPKSSDPKGLAEERTLQRLIVKSVTMVSDKCPPVK